MAQLAGGMVIGFLAGLLVALAVLRKRRRRADLAMGKPSPTQPDRKRRDLELEELGKLTGELAHEIKNPLSTIKVNLKLVTEELEASGVAEPGNQAADGDRQSLNRALKKIAVIEKEASRLEQILDGFLCYVDRTELQLARTDINELVGDMIDFYSPQAYSHSITIRQGFHGESLICKADAGMLKQAILNLFINAQQAMSDGGELIVRTDRQNNEAVIQVSDTGTGIAPDRLHNIFTAYHSSRPQGRGLGLATTKKIVEAHQGTIAVDSEPGKGTCFTIRLPLLRTDSSVSEVSR